MSKLIEASGTLTVQSDVSVTGQGRDQRQLTLGPGGSSTGQRYFEAVASAQPELATPGAVGAAFEELDPLDGLSEIQLLYLRSSAQVVLRLYALPAELLAVAGLFPTGFSGGESLVMTIDGAAVTTTFLAGDQTADDCAKRINAACALLGIATPVVTVESGQLKVVGSATKVASGGLGQIAVTAGAPATRLGLAAATNPEYSDAQGQDITVDGLFLSEFPRTGSRILTKVTVSGQATLDVVAAGRS